MHGLLRIRNGLFRFQKEICRFPVLLQFIGGLPQQHQQTHLAVLCRHLYSLLLLILGKYLPVLAHIVQPQKKPHSGLRRHLLQGLVLQKPFIKALGFRSLFQFGGQHGGLKSGDSPVPVIHTGRFQHLAIFGISFSQASRIRTQGGIPHPGHQNKLGIRFRIAHHRTKHGGGCLRITAGKKQASQTVLGVHLQIILFRIANHELVILDGLIYLPGRRSIRRQTVGGGGNQGGAARLNQSEEQAMCLIFPAQLLQTHGSTILRQRSLGGLGETLGKFQIFTQA